MAMSAAKAPEAKALLKTSGRPRGPGSLHELMENQSRDLKRRQKQLLESTLPELAATIRTVEQSRPKSRERQARVRPRVLVTGNTATTSHIAHSTYNRTLSSGGERASRVTRDLKSTAVEDKVAMLSGAKLAARRMKLRAAREPSDTGTHLIAQAGMSAPKHSSKRPGSGEIRAARRDPALVEALYVTTVLIFHLPRP